MSLRSSAEILGLPTRLITQWANVDEAFLDVTTAIKGALRKRDPRLRQLRRHRLAARLFAPRRAARRIFDQAICGLRSVSVIAIRIGFFMKRLSIWPNSSRIRWPNCRSVMPTSMANFRRIDANRFTAVAYRDGEAVARCSIFLGDRSGFAHGIAYSHDTSSGTTAFNENLSSKVMTRHSICIPLGWPISAAVRRQVS